MEVIRCEQMEVFQAIADPAFFRRVASHLRGQYPDLTTPLTDELLALLVARGVARARGHALTWESSLVRFIELMLTVAPNFDEQQAIRARLCREDVSELARMNGLFEATTLAQWRQASRAYDPWAWGIDINRHPILLDLRGAFPR